MQQDDLNNDDESLIINIGIDHPILPEGKYKLIEYYCTDQNCDCNSGSFLMIQLDSHGKETPKMVGLMDYTWNQPISIDNPILGLEPGNHVVDLKFAEAGLKEFHKLLTTDNNTLIKIKNGYAQTREDFKNHPEDYHLATIKKANKIGRNDPCPCGSGKKYKKCCL